MEHPVNNIINQAFTLIDEKEDYLIIDKASGVNFHRENNEPGIGEIVKLELQIDTLLPVHRLDKITSGLMVFAKNRTTASELANQFRERTIDKFYIAISDRKPSKKRGTIKGDMERSRRGTWRLNRSLEDPSKTIFISRGTGSPYRIFLLKPVTGKTHQLRVVMKSIGSPICGDPLYYPQADRTIDCRLHSFFLGFTLKGQKISYKVYPKWSELKLPSVVDALKDFDEPLKLF